MSPILKLLVNLWCRSYNRRWLRRGEQEHFLKQLENQQDALRSKWSEIVTDRARHRLKEG